MKFSEYMEQKFFEDEKRTSSLRFNEWLSIQDMDDIFRHAEKWNRLEIAKHHES